MTTSPLVVFLATAETAAKEDAVGFWILVGLIAVGIAVHIFAPRSSAETESPASSDDQHDMWTPE